MKNLVLITGGARSGKSRFAEKIAKESEGKVVYIATAIPFDDQMKDRIKKHKTSRPREWVTIERYKDFKDLTINQVFLDSDLVLLDCITLMVSNLLMDSGLNFASCSMEKVGMLEKSIFEEIRDLLNLVELHDKKLILVSNEVGMGLVPPFRMGNIFRDISGRVNQHMAREAEEVYFMVSGIPMKVK